MVSININAVDDTELVKVLRRLANEVETSLQCGEKILQHILFDNQRKEVGEFLREGARE